MAGTRHRAEHDGGCDSSVNLAACLCDQAGDRQMLVNQRVHATVEQMVESEPTGELRLKALQRPVPAFGGELAGR